MHTFNKIYIFLLSIYFLLNFLGSPLLKMMYLVVFLFVTFTIITKDWADSLLILSTFIFIEGQGRIIWGYHPWSRLAFDVILLTAMIKNFIKNKKLYDSSVLPSYLKAVIILHFLWYTLLLFNPIGVPFYIAIATAKYYVIPILLFFSFSISYKDLDQKFIKELSYFIIVISFLEILLNIFQKYQSDQFMFQISMYYKNLFPKFLEFTGARFRPWGTTFSPGGISVYLALTVGFLFLHKNKRSYQTFKNSIFIALSWFTMLIMQVRSAWLKHITITLLCLVVYVLSLRSKAKDTIKIGVILFIITSAIVLNFKKFQKYAFGMDLTTSIERIEKISSYDGLSSQRKGFFFIVDKALENFKLLGFGVGLGGGVNLKSFVNKRASLIKNENIQFWSYDNFFLFTIYELGLGFIFFVGIYIFSCIYMLTLSYKSYVKKYDSFNITSIAFIVSLVTIIGNWGAVGICYNPESFFFWLWITIGISSYKASENKSKQNSVVT